MDGLLRLCARAVKRSKHANHKDCQIMAEEYLCIDQNCSHSIMKMPEKSSWKYAFALTASMIATAGADTRQNAGVTEENVDLIEYNNLYDENGDATLDQIILWNWDIHDKAYRCCDFLVVGTPTKPLNNNKPGEKRDCKAGSELNYPMKTKDGNYRSIVSKMGKTRIIYGNLMRETWTQFDPEIADQEHIPKHQRLKPLQTPISPKAPEDFLNNR